MNLTFNKDYEFNYWKELLTPRFLSDVSKEGSDFTFGDGSTEARIGASCSHEGFVSVESFAWAVTLCCLA